MISTKDVVVQYRPNRVNDITDQQIAYIPRLEEDQVECSMPYYIYEGKKVAINPKKQIVFKLRYLHFNDKMNSIKRRNYRSCRTILLNLINKKVLKPFMLFINGIFISWAAISIIINNDDYYLMIDFDYARAISNLCQTYQFVQMFSLPDSMYYIDMRHTKPNSKPLFMFNQNGLFTIDLREAVDGITQDIVDIDSFSYFRLNRSVNAVRLYDNNKKIKISDKNIFLFVNGKLNFGVLKKIKRSRLKTKIVDGKETAYLEFYYSNHTVNNNLSISIVGNLISVDDGKITNSVFDIMLFMNSSFTSENLDNIMRITEASRIDAVMSANNGVILPYYSRLSRPFDLPISMNSASSIPLSENFIAGYNPCLFNELVKTYSTIEIQELKGSDILKSIAKAKRGNVISIALKHDGMYEERILLFINGLLYVNHSISTLNTNTINIPIRSTISADDAVEIMRFKNVNNFETNIVVNEHDGFIYQCGALVNDDMCLFCKTPSQSEYTYPEDGFQQFEVEYTLEYDEKGYVKIVLTDEFYYGKELTVAYKNRFVYKNFKISKNNTDSINMENHFKYCIDVNRYMIFVNGRLLNKNRYNIAIPCDPASDNYQFLLHLNAPLKGTDRLDVVYVSTDLEDFLLQDELDPTGDIAVDQEDLDYVFSKELYMIWINGKKIPISQLDDINTTCIRVNKDQKTTSNLRVIKYIKCSILQDLISSTQSDWDKGIFDTGMSRDAINAIIGKKDIVYTNTEPDYGGTNTTNQPAIDISNNVLILSGTNNNMTFSISNSVGILDDHGDTIQTDIDSNVLYINYEGSN